MQYLRGYEPHGLIGTDGTLTEVDDEKSTNVELGVRGQLTDSWILQTAYLRTDFSNLIAVGSIAECGTSLSQGNRQPYASKNTLPAALGYEQGAFRGEV